MPRFRRGWRHIRRQTMRSEEAEKIRKRYLYRRLILTGKIALPYRAAARLIGPDCAYHLYSTRGQNAPSGPADVSPKNART